MTNPIILIAFGLMVGVFSGLMGLGGGSVMIPIMVLVLGMTQAEAHGTSLAVMTVPVMLPAVIRYHQGGNLKLSVAAWMACGVLAGTYFGASLANTVSTGTLKLIFGFVLIYVAGYSIFSKGGIQRATVLSMILVVLAVCMFQIVRWYDARTALEKTTVAMEQEID
jgi:uncharacterized protein